MEDPYKYFQIEAEELLENLIKGLLAFEKRPEDLTLLNDLFRYAHTLKGAANVVKLSCISQIAHEIEDRLVMFRDQGKRVVSEDVTLLLDAVAAIGDVIQELKAGRLEDSVDMSSILARLNRTCFESKDSACDHEKLAPPKKPGFKYI